MRANVFLINTPNVHNMVLYHNTSPGKPSRQYSLVICASASVYFELFFRSPVQRVGRQAKPPTDNKRQHKKGSDPGSRRPHILTGMLIHCVSWVCIKHFTRWRGHAPYLRAPAVFRMHIYRAQTRSRYRNNNSHNNGQTQTKENCEIKRR